MTHREDIIDKKFSQMQYGFDTINPLDVSENVNPLVHLITRL